MAKTVVLTDDIDGSANAETVEFSLKGTSYEIDLSPKNQAALEKALKPYLDAGLKVSSRGRSSKGRAKAASGVDVSAVRAWASENGHEVSTRGRISQAVLEHYRAAGN